MKNETTKLPSIGEQYQGGFFAGRFNLDGKVYALIVAPKEQGENNGSAWNGSYKDVDDAKSYNDGLKNSLAMAAASSDLAKWAFELEINGFNDWYIPSQDELEILYRYFKPATEENWCYVRSGINLSAVEPTRPYTPQHPEQTSHNLFKADEQEAFSDVAYWSSTQHASDSVYAWCQDFSTGNQRSDLMYDQGRARAVRRVTILNE